VYDAQAVPRRAGNLPSSETPLAGDRDERPTILRTVRRTLSVLDLLASQPERDWGATELAQDTGIHKSTMFRILATLEDAEYVTRHPDMRTYRVGSAALVLGAAASVALKDVAGPVLRKLSVETGETALLHVLSGHTSLCIDKVESHHPVRVTYDIGRRGPLYAGTAGKTLLAFIPPTEFDMLVPYFGFVQFTEKTITDLDSLKDELWRTKQRGYSLSYGELDVGASSVGAPIWNSLGRLEAGISIVTPSSRWVGDRIESYIQATLNAAKEVSIGLGYRFE
jgi:IclR family transcriptional regulator, KDG regulon repressor